MRKVYPTKASRVHASPDLELFVDTIRQSQASIGDRLRFEYLCLSARYKFMHYTGFSQRYPQDHHHRDYISISFGAAEESLADAIMRSDQELAEALKAAQRRYGALRWLARTLLHALRNAKLPAKTCNRVGRIFAKSDEDYKKRANLQAYGWFSRDCQDAAAAYRKALRERERPKTRRSRKHRRATA